MVKLRTRAVLLEVVVRSEVLGWRRLMVSFSQTMMMMEEVVLVGVVAIDSRWKVLLHLQRKTTVRSIDSDSDGGGRWWPAMASRVGQQWRAEQSVREEEGKWEMVSSGDAHTWG
jgi:hypothetical protein